MDFRILSYSTVLSGSDVIPVCFSLPCKVLLQVLCFIKLDVDDDADVPGYEGSVLGGEGAETEVLEIPLQVHDVVPET